MFGRKKDPAKDQSETPDVISITGDKKGHPTPKRKDQEAANKRPLVAPTAKKTTREERAKAQADYDRAMKTADERYLPVRDKGPQRRYARDFIDARWTFAEFMLPVMILFLVATFALNSVPVFAAYSLIAMYVILIAAIFDTTIAGFQLKKRLNAKFGSVEKGVRWYMTMRTFQIRPMRLPKPQVKRGEFPS